MAIAKTRGPSAPRAPTNSSESGRPDLSEAAVLHPHGFVHVCCHQAAHERMPRAVGALGRDLALSGPALFHLDSGLFHDPLELAGKAVTAAAVATDEPRSEGHVGIIAGRALDLGAEPRVERVFTQDCSLAVRSEGRGFSASAHRTSTSAAYARWPCPEPWSALGEAAQMLTILLTPGAVCGCFWLSKTLSTNEWLEEDGGRRRIRTFVGR